MKLSLISFIFFIVTTTQIFAQHLRLQPIAQYSQYAINSNQTTQKLTNGRTETVGCPSDTVAIQLPFFDDFSSAKNGLIDTAKWLCGSGAYLNNSLPYRPLSFNAVSFDGVDNYGKPYNFVTPTATGVADVLTSRPINVTGTNIANVYLSFYVQPQGNGERPDKGDSLILQFKDDKNVWVHATGYEATDDWKEFRYQAIRLDIVGGFRHNFYHKNFQFRFLSKTRLSGAYDVWNVDYVYLAADRNPLENFFDMAIGTRPRYFLKEYTAMPLQHFNTKYSNFDSLKSSMNYLEGLGNSNVLQYKVVIKDGITKDTFGTAMDTTIAVPVKSRELPMFGLMKRVKMPKELKQKTLLQVEFQMKTGELDATYGFKTTTNDTLSSTVVLDNYYAYDDGSAEYGIAFNQKFGRIAYEFDASKDDKLYSVDVMFVPLGFNLAGETFNLHIVKSITVGGGFNKDSTLLVQNYFLSYPDSLNKFTRLVLPRPLDMKAGKFYVVIEQLSDKNLTIGFDKNNDSSQKIYVNVTNKWELDKFIKGSLMLRPVFGATILGTDAENLANSYTIYPNPTQNEIYIEGNEVEKATLVNTLGQMMLEKTFEFGDLKTLNLNHLANGMYFLYLQNQGKTVVKKVILAK
jgi:hypothetical protein